MSRMSMTSLVEGRRTDHRTIVRPTSTASAGEPLTFDISFECLHQNRIYLTNRDFESSGTPPE